MSISLSKYVEITSAVAASAGVARRELIGRLFSEDPKTPVGSVVEFTDAASVGAYYRTTSEEYARAVFYFGFVSKSLSTPKKLGFSRFARVASSARIYGVLPAPLLQLQAITAGTLSITVGGQTAALTGLNFSAALSYADVATALQTAIRAAAGTQFTTATVVYESVTGIFRFTASPTSTAAASVSVDPSGGASVATAIGWGPGAVLSGATPAQTVSDALTTAAGVSNNFGSFAFVTPLNQAETIEAAQWNAARNVEYIFCARVPAADAVATSAALIGLPGTAMTLATVATQYDEMAPMMILAATDYTRRGAVQNYMFQVLNLTPKVSTDALSATYDALRVNYYGNTQTAGQQVNFYQRGVMTGSPTAPVDMNVYANEVWLKDAASSALMALLMSVPRVPANDEGRAQILAILQDPIDQALFNGAISVGKVLSTAQRLYVTELSDDPDAWRQVQALGYWVDCRIISRPQPNGVIEFVAQYTLIYSKDDAIRKVEGSHILV